MCGIAGGVGISGHECLEAMAGVLAHRGPDDQGMRYFPENKVGFGFRRLSIIDLSPAGHQPMSNEDGTVWIAFNGEIYNFRELRQRLEPSYRFRSNTDTEAILHLYEAEGLDFVRHLNGMFAIAIYDSRPPAPSHPNSPNLVLVRDRLGIKPLYYCRPQGAFLFASEIKALLASGMYRSNVNRQAMWDYFTYLYVPCPETMFQGILQFPPAHLMEVDIETREASLKRYWHPLASQVNGSVNRSLGSYEEDKSNLRELLADAVRMQMVSDVPLGVFLSGGIDSAIVTGLMAQSSRQPVKSFTVVFRGKGLEFYNEQQAARKVSSRFGTDHRELDVEVPDPMEMLDLVEHFDQPFGNPTFYLMHLISKHTRPEATVALCGAGGDELFGGYPRYRAIRLARLLRWAPSPAIAIARWFLSLPRDDYRAMRLRRARQFFEGLDRDAARQFVKWTYFMDEVRKDSVLTKSPETGNHILPSDRVVRNYMTERGMDGSANGALLLDLQTFLPDNILEYTDKMSMAVSLEVRVPLLDHRVVELVAAMPFDWKVRGRNTKAILKDACADLLPEEHLTAPKKGFNVPLAMWMRDRLDGYFDAHLDRAEVEKQGIFQWEGIQRLRTEHAAGWRDNAHELFSIIMFDVWYQKYILQKEPLGFRRVPSPTAGRR